MKLLSSDQHFLQNDKMTEKLKVEDGNGENVLFIESWLYGVGKSSSSPGLNCTSICNFFFLCSD